MIKTKIIATLGPSCDQKETIKPMIDNGVDIFRLNFSHGTLDAHAQLLENLNAVRAEHRHTTAVMGDLCGVKTETYSCTKASYMGKAPYYLSQTAFS